MTAAVARAEPGDGDLNAREQAQSLVPETLLGRHVDITCFCGQDHRAHDMCPAVRRERVDVPAHRLAAREVTLQARA